MAPAETVCLLGREVLLESSLERGPPAVPPGLALNMASDGIGRTVSSFRVPWALIVRTSVQIMVTSPVMIDYCNHAVPGSKPVGYILSFSISRLPSAFQLFQSISKCPSHNRFATTAMKSPSKAALSSCPIPSSSRVIRSLNPLSLTRISISSPMYSVNNSRSSSLWPS